MRTRLLLGAALVAAPSALAQPAAPPADWHLGDGAGISVARAYEALDGRTATPIVVAVIDSGIDIEHPDLAPAIWTNPGEIAGNGIDDDGNGFVDDVHGWNFLGGADGRHIEAETLEIARLVAACNAGAPLAGTDCDAVTAELQEERAMLTQQLGQMAPIFSQVNAADAMLREHFPDTYDGTNAATLDVGRDTEARRAQAMIGMLAANGATLADIQAFEEQLMSRLEVGLNPDYEVRADVIGDDPLDTADRAYGNADVAGPDPSHGTGVAGLIAAIRGNGDGIDGVAPNTADAQPVRIMVLRAVPNGDERDKDIANAIRYAVDNGARIINMSFGKSFSPQKAAVDAAVQYAADRGVLLIHASGNDGADLEPEGGNFNFPSALLDDDTKSPVWLEIGASADDLTALAAPFSNYGQTRVDLFAPGAQVTSLTPGGGVSTEDGTSFASPVVAGVAALVLTYFPDLTAEELRAVLVDSATRYAETETGRPGDGQLVAFGTLSVTGGVVNAAEAVRLASERADG